MGKSNRVRTKRAEEAIKNPLKTKNQKKGAPSWLYSAIAIAVAVIVLMIAVLSAVSSSGFVKRSTKAVYSENYTIDANVFQYMLSAEYQQFLTDYSSYLTYLSLDTTKDLDKQTFGGADGTAYDATLLGEFKGTWHEYFVSRVTEQAEQLLIYCEEADARGIKLESSDLAEVNSALLSMELMAQAYGYSLDGYVAANYGAGIKAKDVRKAMEISTLAAKCASLVDEEIIDAITDEEIAAKYDANKKDYNVVDYVYYTFKVDFEEIAKEIISGYDGKTKLTAEQEATVLEEYKSRIATAKENAKKLEAAKTVEKFLDIIFNDHADKKFDELYKTEALADADKLGEEALANVKASMIAKAIEEIKAGKTEAEKDSVKSEDGAAYTAYGETVTEKAAVAVDSIKQDLFAALNSVKKSSTVEKLGYDENDQISKWSFEEGRAVNDTKLITLGDGAEDGAEITNKKGSFDASVYMMKATEYCDKTLSKNVAYMTFGTKEAAENAIKALGEAEKLDAKTFETIAADRKASASGAFDNYLKGQLSYLGFDEWLYNAETAVGSYTKTPLANAEKDATEYAVFYYIEDGDEAWYIDVQAAIYAEDYETMYDALVEKYPVKEGKGISMVEVGHSH